MDDFNFKNNTNKLISLKNDIIIFFIENSILLNNFSNSKKKLL